MDYKQKLSHTKDYIFLLLISALTLLFTQSLSKYISDKLLNYNIFGIDSQLFIIIAIGGIIIVLVYVGIVKEKKAIVT